MAGDTDRHALPLLQAGQSQKEITHNEAIVRLDALLHLAVESRTLAEPPPTPAPGAAWIVAAGATGAWSGQSGRLAFSQGGGWAFVDPIEGCLAWSKSERMFLIRTAVGWTSGEWPAASIEIDGVNVVGQQSGVVPAPFGGAVVDSEARSSIGQILAVLRAHGLVASG